MSRCVPACQSTEMHVDETWTVVSPKLNIAHVVDELPGLHLKILRNKYNLNSIHLTYTQGLIQNIRLSYPVNLYHVRSILNSASIYCTSLNLQDMYFKREFRSIFVLRDYREIVQQWIYNLITLFSPVKNQTLWSHTTWITTTGKWLTCTYCVRIWPLSSKARRWTHGWLRSVLGRSVLNRGLRRIQEMSQDVNDTHLEMYSLYH